MPLKDWNLKATWDAAYRFGAEGDVGHPNTRPEVKLHYHRFEKYGQSVARAQRLSQVLNWTPPGPSIVIFGAGFGWTVERLEALGFTRVLGIDTSAYIQAQKNVSDEAEVDAAIAEAGLDPNVGTGFFDGPQVKARIMARIGGARQRRGTSRDILNESGATGGSRNAIKDALGVPRQQLVEWCVTESVIESLTNAEAQALSAQIHVWASTVAHFIYPLLPDTTQDPEMNWQTAEQWKTALPNDLIIESPTFRVL